MKILARNDEPMKRLLTTIILSALSVPITVKAGGSIFDTDDASQHKSLPAAPGLPAAPAPTTNTSKPQIIVFVLSGGGSMINHIAQAKIDLKHHIDQLGPDEIFDVVYAQERNTKPIFPMPVQANDDNKKKAYGFLADCVTEGRSSLYDGLNIAIQLQPTQIVMLTNAIFLGSDPDHKEEQPAVVLNKIKEMNSRTHAIITTTDAYVDSGAKAAPDQLSTEVSIQLLHEIAEQNRAPGTEVAPSPLTQPAVASFIGYTFHKTGNNAPWSLTLEPNGVINTDYPIRPDHWEETGTHVLIFWTDGIIDMLTPAADGTFDGKGFKANNSGKGWGGTVDPPPPER
jgi:hypothetical protein